MGKYYRADTVSRVYSTQLAREPLNNSSASQSFGRHRGQGALSQECVGLSRKGNAGHGVVRRTRRAGLKRAIAALPLLPIGLAIGGERRLALARFRLR